jgi:hypothetical protein
VKRWAEPIQKAGRHINGEDAMLVRRTVFGLAVLGALVIGAFISASASAEQLAYTCTTTAPAGSKNFSDEHCVVPAGVGKGTRGHVLIPPGTITQIGATNAFTASSTTSAATWIWGIIAAAIKLKVVCNAASGTGSLKNAAASVSGTVKLQFTGCTVTEPAGKGCVVKGGTIETSNLNFTTVGQAANRLKFESEVEKGNFATIPIEGCAGEAPPKANYPATGSLVATTEGATTSTTLAGVEAEGKFKVAGNKAGLEGKITIRMAEGEPIVLT